MPGLKANYIITQHYISIKMAPLAKLAVISEIEGEAALVKNFRLLMTVYYVLDL